MLDGDYRLFSVKIGEEIVFYSYIFKRVPQLWNTFPDAKLTSQRNNRLILFIFNANSSVYCE